MEEKLKIRIGQAISEKILPGCVLGVSIVGKRQIFPFGSLAYNNEPVKENTIYDLASVTKAVPTMSLLLALIDQEKISRKTHVADIIPEFGGTAHKDSVLIEHLLTYTLDFNLPRLSTLRDLPPQNILESIISAPLRGLPGAKYEYANSTAILAGLVVEKVSGKPLADLAKEYFFDPLGMTRTSFAPLALFPQSEIAPSEVVSWRGGEVRGVVHDESAYALSKLATAGSAGLFSTAPDLLNFLEMLFAGGKECFSESMIREMESNQLSHIGDCAGLGWSLAESSWMGNLSAPDTFGKTGFTGTFVLCNRRLKLAVSFLSNQTYPHRKEDTFEFKNLRRDICSIVSEAVL